MLGEPLVRSIACGDQRAFEALYQTARSLVHRTCLRVLGNHCDAEEATNDTFAYVWRHADRYSATRGSVSAWLVTIARSRALDRRRWLGARGASVAAPLGELEAIGPSPEHLAIGNQRRLLARRALTRLPTLQRKALWLLHERGLTHQDAAHQLHVPLGTLKTRARLGTLRLRTDLARATGLAPRSSA